MKTLTRFSLFASMLLVTATLHAADETGFKPLFDGQSLGQWDGDKLFWRVEGGSIIGETTARGASSSTS